MDLMKRKLLILTILFFGAHVIFAQCREYIKAIAPSKLGPYVIDGNFFAPIVYEGDEVTLKRTFLAGQQYKIIVMGMDIWQKYITIKDQNGLVLFQNYIPKHKKELNCSFKDYEGNTIPCLGATYFEFKPDHTMNVEITVKIEQKAKKKKDRIRGCLGIVVGFLPSSKIKTDSTKQIDSLQH